MFICLQCVCFFTACLSKEELLILWIKQISTYLMNWIKGCQWGKKKTLQHRLLKKQINELMRTIWSTCDLFLNYLMRINRMWNFDVLGFVCFFLITEGIGSVIILVIVVLVVTLSWLFLKAPEKHPNQLCSEEPGYQEERVPFLSGTNRAR